MASEVFSCKVCGQNFQSKNQYAEHVSNQHPKNTITDQKSFYAKENYSIDPMAQKGNYATAQDIDDMLNEPLEDDMPENWREDYINSKKPKNRKN